MVTMVTEHTDNSCTSPGEARESSDGATVRATVPPTPTGTWGDCLRVAAGPNTWLSVTGDTGRGSTLTSTLSTDTCVNMTVSALQDGQGRGQGRGQGMGLCYLMGEIL